MESSILRRHIIMFGTDSSRNYVLESVDLEKACQFTGNFLDQVCLF
jgi:hypothetical protein